MAGKADQSKMSRKEVKDAHQTGTLRSGVGGAKKWFKDYIRRNWSKQAYTRLCNSAKIRKMTPLAYAEKVLLK